MKSAKANVEQLSAQQGFEKIIAPFSGTITFRKYDVGALISPTDTAQRGMSCFASLKPTNCASLSMFPPVLCDANPDRPAGAGSRYRVSPIKEFPGKVRALDGGRD